LELDTCLIICREVKQQFVVAYIFERGTPLGWARMQMLRTVDVVTGSLGKTLAEREAGAQAEARALREAEAAAAASAEAAQIEARPAAARPAAAPASAPAAAARPAAAKPAAAP